MGQSQATTKSDTPPVDQALETAPVVEQGVTRLGCLQTVLVVAMVAVLLFLGTWRNYWTDGLQDQYDLLQVGRCVYHGGRLYVHAVDDGMPGTAWLGALGYALSGGRAMGAWVLPGVVAAVAIALIGVAAWRLLDARAGRRIALVSALVLAIDVYGGTSIGRAFYATTGNVAAATLFLLSLGSRRIGRRVGFGIGAGLAWAAALAMTHTGCVGLVVVTLVGLGIAAFVRSQRGDWLATIGCAWTGFLVGLASIIVALESCGVTSAAWAHFVDLWRVQLAGVPAAALWKRLVASLSLLQLLLWFVLVGLIGAAFGIKANHLARSTMIALMCWWVAACGLVGFKTAPTMSDWAETLPPMLWLTVIGVYYVGESTKVKERKVRVPLYIAMITILVILARPLVQQFRVGVRAARSAKVDASGERNRLSDFGEMIGEFVPSRRSIYILDGNAGVYVHADRSPASAVIRPASAADVETALNDLEARYAFAVLAPDNLISLGPACDGACMRRLQRLLSDYDEIVERSGYSIYIRRAESNSAETPN